MPVLIENDSLLAPRGAVEARAPGGWPGLAARLGPSHTCVDAGLVCLSFAEPRLLVAAVRALASDGLWMEADGEPAELAYVSQRGPAGWWPWLELGHVPGPDGATVLAARLAGDGGRDVVCPAGWRFEGSPTQRDGIDPLSPADRPLRHLRRDEAGDVYLDRLTGEEVLLRHGSPPARLMVEAATGERKASLTAEVVREPLEVEVGLMFREALAPDAGMLFLFPREARQSFWMKNTLVPLDLLFLAADGTVVGVVERAAPLTLAPRQVHRPSRSVLEVPGGWAAAHGVGEGDRVEDEARGSRPGGR